MRPIVDELVGVVRVTVLTQDRLRDPASLDLDRHRLVADVTLEERLSHLRNQGGRADHQPVDRDQFVDVCKEESRVTRFMDVIFIQVLQFLKKM